MLQYLPQRRRLPRNVRHPEGEPVPFRDRAQRRFQRLGLRGSVGGLLVEQVRQRASRGGLGVPALHGPRVLEVGLVGKRQSPVERLGCDREPVELGKRLPDERFRGHRFGRHAGDALGATHLDPCARRDGHQAWAFRQCLFNMEERRVQLFAAQPDDAASGGHDSPADFRPVRARRNPKVQRRLRFDGTCNACREPADPKIDRVRQLGAESLAVRPLLGRFDQPRRRELPQNGSRQPLPEQRDSVLGERRVDAERYRPRLHAQQVP